jgi:hypothetical protein
MVEVTPRFEPHEQLEEVIADPGRTAWPARVTLLQCPVCSEAIVVRAFRAVFESRWMEPYRIWPDPERSPFEPIPEIVRASLAEARRCLSCGAYTASVAMSGRAFEAIARHFHTGPDASQLMLGKGLAELREKSVIDDRLFRWGKELHEHRNQAAHPSGASFARRDAQELLDFALAICDYVFVLQAKYEAFMKRKDAKQNQPSLSGRQKRRAR